MLIHQIQSFFLPGEIPSCETNKVAFVRITPLIGAMGKSAVWYCYNIGRWLVTRRSQSDEAAILKRLAPGAPKTFIEFGFHPREYNCIGLRDYRGLLIDGDRDIVKLGKILLPSRIRVENAFLAVDDLSVVKEAFDQVGVLSIDVDGNDYWFAEALFSVSPAVLSVEYNASFGFNSITVPYDPAFDRGQKHHTGWYHGASLPALTKLANRFGYKLAAVSTGGMNAFYVPRQRADVAEIHCEAAYRENRLRNHWSGKTASKQWESIKNLDYVSV